MTKRLPRCAVANQQIQGRVSLTNSYACVRMLNWPAYRRAMEIRTISQKRLELASSVTTT